MKRIISVFLLTIILFSLITCNASAISKSSNETIIFLENGFYAVVTVEENTILRATKTKSGSKTIDIYNNNNEKIFDATITGTFTYTGSSATCTNATISYNIYADNWKMKEATASKSGNKAVGDVTAKRYLLGIPVETVEQTFYLTCSATGTLS